MNKDKCPICNNEYKRSFGAGEFKIIVSHDNVKLVIHNKTTVAESNVDIYSELFNYCKKRIEESNKK